MYVNCYVWFGLCDARTLLSREMWDAAHPIATTSAWGPASHYLETTLRFFNSQFLYTNVFNTLYSYIIFSFFLKNMNHLYSNFMQLLLFYFDSYLFMSCLCRSGSHPQGQDSKQFPGQFFFTRTNHEQSNTWLVKHLNLHIRDHIDPIMIKHQIISI